jgi:putative glycosyltransferase (TIGR04372 family)
VENGERRRFIYGDTSVSSGIPGVPNLLEGIGHIASIDGYLKMVRLGWFGKIQPTMCLHDSSVVNPYLLARMEPHLTILREPAAIKAALPAAQAWEELINNFMMVGERPIFNYHAAAMAQAEWERQGRGPLLSIPAADRLRARGLLAEWGIGADGWFVCLHVRDNGFRREREACKENRGLENPNNADIGSYRTAIEAVADRGGWVLRMGGAEMTPLPFSHPRLIDYAHSPARSADMDIILCGLCRFFIGTCSGLSGVPRLFGVPTIYTNVTPAYVRPASGADLFIPKLLRTKTDGRRLSFRECWAEPYGRTFRPEILDVFGLVNEDNCSGDLHDITVEMMDSLDGCDPGDGPDERDLRRRFDSLAEISEIADGGFGSAARLGRAFLRRHAGLLADMLEEH